MNSPDYLLTYLSPDQAGIIWVLLLILKSSLLLGMALAAIYLWRAGNPAGKVHIIRFALAGLIILPLVSLIMPSLNVPWAAGLTREWLAVSSKIVILEGAKVEGSISNLSGISPAIWLIAVWLTGVLFFMRRFFGAVKSASIIRKNSQAVIDRSVVELCKRLAESYSIRKGVKVVVSAKAQSPFVFGVFRPTIILPQSSGGWTGSDLRIILMHELAHIRRHDLFWIYVNFAITAIFWFNPLIWIARRKMITESDKACDDFVVSGGTDPAFFAMRLVDIARSIGRSHGRVQLGTGMANKSQLEERIMSILSQRKKSTAVSSRLLVFFAVLTLLVVIPLAGVHLRADETAGTKSEKAEQQKIKVKEKLPSPDEFIPLTTPPAQVHLEQPDYPAEAQKAGIEGTAIIQALIDKEGTVLKATVKKSSGEPILDDAALKAAYKCKYSPGLQDDNPVAVWVAYTVTFSLEDKDGGPAKK